MIKCNLLGRGEARSNMKLEKAMDKISKLQVSSIYEITVRSLHYVVEEKSDCLSAYQARVQQLERAIEIKDNDTIRGVKKGSGLSMHRMDMDGVSHLNSVLPKKKKLCDSPRKAFPVEHLETEANDLLHLKDEYSHNSENNSLSNKQTSSFIVIEDDDISITDKKVKDLSKLNTAGQDDETSCQENKNLFTDVDAFTTKDSKDASLQFGDIVHVQPSVHIRNENSSSSMFAQPGKLCTIKQINCLDKQ